MNTKVLRRIMLASAVLILLATLFVAEKRTDHTGNFMAGLTFTAVTDGGQALSFQAFCDEEDGRYYLVLPSCFDGKDVELTVHYAKADGQLYLNGKALKSGETIHYIAEKDSADFRVQGQLGVRYIDSTLQILTSENLPAVFVTVEDTTLLMDDDEVEKQKYMQTGDLTMVDETGTVLLTDHLEKFKVRGNLTATLDKKPYTFTLSEQKSILGMTAAEKWNLIANATDGSYMRNKIVMDLSNEANPEQYEPDGEYVELYLNGDYQGLYLLTEAAEAAEGRLKLPQNSLFLEMELDFRQEEGETYVMTDRLQKLFELEEIKETKQPEDRALRILNDIESALLSDDGISEISGKPLSELIDMRSWAIAYIVEEISGDHDVGIASQFAYTLGDDELLYAGPVWDFDGTFGNVNTPMYRNPVALTASIANSRPEGNANQNTWLAAMYENVEFREEVQKVYGDLFEEPLQRVLEDGIDDYTETISRAAMLDALRWQTERLSWAFVLPDGIEMVGDDYTRYDTLLEQVEMVRDFLSQKKAFLDDIWLDGSEYCVVEVHRDMVFLNQDYNQTLYCWILKGQPLDLTETTEGYTAGFHFLGFYDTETGERIGESTPVSKDMVIEERWE